MSTPHARGRMRRTRKAVFVVAVGALMVAALAVFIGQGAAASAHPGNPPWLDAHKPIQARVNALLGAMTLAEKVGQMDQQLVDNLTGPSTACGSQGWAQLNQSCMKTWLVDNQHGLAACGRYGQPTGYDRSRRHRQHRLRLGQRVQPDPAVRDPELAAAHPVDLRGRRRARLRASLAGAALPPVDRHGRHLGSGGGACRRSGDR